MLWKNFWDDDQQQCTLIQQFLVSKSPTLVMIIDSAMIHVLGFDC